MEPLRPEMREALKRSNPGLTDRDIDRSEEILAQLEDLDSEDEPDRYEQLRIEFQTLLRDRMPRYRDVAQSFADALRADARMHVRPAVRVIKKSDGQR